MTHEWIRFWITAIILIAALIFLIAAVVGNYRFSYVMNRIHAAGIGDTAGIALTVVALAVSARCFSDGARLFLPLFFLWITSPVSSHFMSMIEYYTNPHLYKHVDRLPGDDEDQDTEADADMDIDTDNTEGD